MAGGEDGQPKRGGKKKVLDNNLTSFGYWYVHCVIFSNYIRYIDKEMGFAGSFHMQKGWGASV